MIEDTSDFILQLVEWSQPWSKGETRSNVVPYPQPTSTGDKRRPSRYVAALVIVSASTLFLSHPSRTTNGQIVGDNSLTL